MVCGNQEAARFEQNQVSTSLTTKSQEYNQRTTIQAKTAPNQTNIAATNFGINTIWNNTILLLPFDIVCATELGKTPKIQAKKM